MTRLSLTQWSFKNYHALDLWWYNKETLVVVSYSTGSGSLDITLYRKYHAFLLPDAVFFGELRLYYKYSFRQNSCSYKYRNNNDNIDLFSRDQVLFALDSGSGVGFI